MTAKPAWIKPTPYERYLRGVEFAIAQIVFNKPIYLADFDTLPKQEQPHTRGIIAQAYGVNLAPRLR